jgi:hypothetical protein
VANLQLVILFLKGVEARGVQLGVILLFDEGLSKQAHTKLVCCDCEIQNPKTSTVKKGQR